MRLEAAKEFGPEGLGLGRTGAQPDNLSSPVGVDRDGEYRGHAHDAPALPDLQVGRIELDIGPVAGERAVEELADTLVDVFTKLQDGTLRDAGEPHGLDEFVDPARRHPTDPGFLDDGDERLLRCPPGLEEAREVGTLLQLQHPQVQRAEPGIERAVAVAVAVRRPPLGALMAAGADHALDIGLYDQLQNRLRDGAEEIILVVLLKQLGEAHGGLGHRGLLR